MSHSLLIVDDSSFSRRMIKHAIPAGWNVEISEADGGQSALDQCQQQQFDFVFLDLTMPEVDGIEVLKQLQQRHYAATIFVISADIQHGVQQEALELGAKGFIPKPITAEQLETMLRQEGAL
ncbi:response regulator [uncultured Ferrimonas sp.]|uniref:response regulator n=1 Tax=uncultured Ferrimonas sp. TaxID=432640 RepID=UPI0026369F0F|nr:response regulator [uncultured Ferrimonas sp.]